MNKTPHHELKRKLLFTIFDKFPDLGDRPTARIFYNKYPEMSESYEDARDYVRYYRGHRGDNIRRMLKVTKYYKDVQSTKII
jgi:hypothetical protein